MDTEMAIEVNMEEKFSQLTLDVIGLSLINFNFDSLKSDSPFINVVYTALKEVESRSTDILPYSQIDLLCKIIPRQIKVAKVVGIIRECVEELIVKCKATIEFEQEKLDGDEYVNESNPSILRFLLASRDEVSSVQLRGGLLSMLVVGHETTSSVLTWTMYLMSENPTSLKKAQEEVDRVLQGRNPQFAKHKSSEDGSFSRGQLLISYTTCPKSVEGSFNVYKIFKAFSAKEGECLKRQ